ncbi:MAG TPA: D-aminoacylase [Steroidobacteraceae bacterium]|jgi:N-acyl-D-amino-acid deacylase
MVNTKGFCGALLVFACLPARADVLLQHVTLYDGSGNVPANADVRIVGERISAVAPALKPLPGEAVRDLHGLALAPGFIDMHSHADRGLLQDLDAETQTRQGITTTVVGQDGESNFPLGVWLSKLDATPTAFNVISMVGQATLREQVMGKDLYRASTEAELAKMKTLLAQELTSGGFGLSTGLEYEQAHFSTTREVVELSKVAAARGGFYISHVRDEADHVFESFDEVLTIGREAGLPVEITHIKLGSTGVWNQAAQRMPHYFETAAREHIQLWADVYPYTYWHSTIRVIVPDRDFFNPEKVKRAIADNGGAAAIRLAHYVPDPKLGGKNLEQIAKIWNVSPVDAYMRIVKATEAEVNSDKELEDIIATSMSEEDVKWFIARPEIAFCTDGELHGAHPRGAGTYPRILGHYVRDEHVLPLTAAIHRMTQLPAQHLKLADRGLVAPGYVADLVVFDPATVIDKATIESPEAAPLGIPAVIVSGKFVVDDGKPTGAHPGKALRAPKT